MGANDEPNGRGAVGVGQSPPNQEFVGRGLDTDALPCATRCGLHPPFRSRRCWQFFRTALLVTESLCHCSLPPFLVIRQFDVGSAPSIIEASFHPLPVPMSLTVIVH